MIVAAVIAAAAALVAIVTLIAWLAHRGFAAADRQVAAEVARAELAAQLELARADVATHQRALVAMAREADAYKEIARAASVQPALPGLAAGAHGAHGVDGLLAAIDFARALLPAEPAAGGDRSAGGGGGLPGGPRAAGGPDDAVGPVTMPEA